VCVDCITLTILDSVDWKSLIPLFGSILIAVAEQRTIRSCNARFRSRDFYNVNRMDFSGMGVEASVGEENKAKALYAETCLWLCLGQQRPRQEDPSSLSRI
jgi:hypothetical protein